MSNNNNDTDKRCVLIWLVTTTIAHAIAFGKPYVHTAKSTTTNVLNNINSHLTTEQCQGTP